MLENRSFDNVLGWLYDPANNPPFNQAPAGQTFNGVSGKGLSNPGPNGEVPVGSTVDTTNPYPDPGEVYQDVYGQLYNVNPPPAPPGKKFEPPPAWTIPPEPPQPPPMTGFVKNYAIQNGVTDPANIMAGFLPTALPTVSTLANQFVVCDNWFASVPSQTLTNRSFMHAGTASGYVNNEVGILPIFVNDTPTIYNLMEEQGISWAIYYGSYWYLTSAYLTQEQLKRYMTILGPKRFFPFSQFLSDAAAGALPSYTFVEPNFMDSIVYGRENDMHPDAAILNIYDQPSNAIFGDELVRKIYQALTASPEAWAKTLFIINFDEHGGCYDHVAPGPATPPDDRAIPKGQDGYNRFNFDRYGVRVPAILISPLLAGGTVDHTLYDHTSILRTVMEQFGVTGDLGQRVANANLLAPTFADAVRTDAPDLSTLVVAEELVTRDGPLNGFQASMVHAAARQLSALNPATSIADPAKLQTRLSAERELTRLAKEAGLENI
jgi:phospholipase C